MEGKPTVICEYQLKDIIGVNTPRIFEEIPNQLSAAIYYTVNNIPLPEKPN